MPTFEHRSVIPASVEQVWAFHASPRSLSQLSPPLTVVQVHRDERQALTAGEFEFTLWLGPLPSRWHVRHEAGPAAYSFVDRALSAPVAAWVHEHTMRPVPGGTELADRIVIEHRRRGFWAVFTRFAFSAPALRLLFVYRHLRTRRLAPRMPASRSQEPVRPA